MAIVDKLGPVLATLDTHLSRDGTNPLAPDQASPDTHSESVGGNPLAPDPTSHDTYDRVVRGTLGSVHGRGDTHRCSDGTNHLAPDHCPTDTHPLRARGTSYADLLVWSETLSDLERVRISVENRIRSAEQGNIAIDALGLGELLDRVRGDEAYTSKQLEKALKRHPLGPWVQSQKGLGLRQVGRLLGVIGDPYVRGPEFDEDGEEVAPSRPRRGPAELWAYCGFHTVPAADHRRNDNQGIVVGGGDVAPRRVRGQQGNWNDAARMRAYLIAESCMKTGGDGKYRQVYDRGREKYAEAVHGQACVRCGPSGKPAAVGSPLSAGHQHARALRLVAKEVLKDLWKESKRLHALVPDHSGADTQGIGVGGH